MFYSCPFSSLGFLFGHLLRRQPHRHHLSWPFPMSSQVWKPWKNAAVQIQNGSKRSFQQLLPLQAVLEERVWHEGCAQSGNAVNQPDGWKGSGVEQIYNPVRCRSLHLSKNFEFCPPIADLCVCKLLFQAIFIKKAGGHPSYHWWMANEESIDASCKCTCRQFLGVRRHTAGMPLKLGMQLCLNWKQLLTIVRG